MASEVIAAPSDPPRAGPSRRVRIAEGLGLRRVQKGEIRELTEQFYLTLRASFSRVDPGVNRAAAATRIGLLLDDRDHSWSAAYEVEQLLVLLYDDEGVRTELAVRLLEAQRVLRAELANHYVEEVKAATGEPLDPKASPERVAADTAKAVARRRVLLARLVNDLQWHYTVDEAKRRYSKLITSRTATLSVLALMAFAAAIALVALGRVQLRYDDVRLFGFAALAGTWGATFSVLTSLKSRIAESSLDDLKLIVPWVTLTSRALIGAGAACILYFFVLSGLLGGTAFPDLLTSQAREAPAAGQTGGASAEKTAGAAGLAPPAGAPLPNKLLAFLVVWCFIAGFSEKFVPGILARTESRADSRGRPEEDRFRPSGDGVTTSGALRSSADTVGRPGPARVGAPPADATSGG